MNEVAVVSGAGSGIGRAVAQRLAKSGYRVALLGRRVSALEQTMGGLHGAGHAVCAGDLTDPAAVHDVAAQIIGEFNQVDAIVHCAGGVNARQDEDLSGLRNTMIASFDANVVSTAMLTEALTPALTDERGRVVAVSSIAALRGGGAAYGTAKAALHGWAFAAAAALGTRRITVNVVAPGYVTETEFFGAAMTQERHDRLVTETMVGRPAEPDDIAATIEHLISRDARHVTAQVIQVNGGALPR